MLAGGSLIMKKVIVLAILVVMLAAPLYAQRMGNMPLTINEPSKSSFSLLDPNRIHMSQSYSFMYSSSRYGSQSLGLYLNSIEYQVSDPLTIYLDIGYLHNPGALVGSRNEYLGDGKIIPAVAVDWKLSNNMFFHFSYREVPGYYYYDGYYEPWYERSGRGAR
jgi:hypothetical protein